jgi:hypothetical protein
MAESGKVQFSLSGGEISPTSLGRSDIERWQSSLTTMRNWIPLSSGSAMNRPGTEFIGYEHKKRSLTAQSFSATTSSSPMLVTATAHGLSDGDGVLIHTTATSPYSITGVESEIEVQDADHFWMLGYDSSSELVSYVGTFYKVDASSRIRIIPFEFGKNDAYAIILGNNHLMIARDGALVLEDPMTVAVVEYPALGEPLSLTLVDNHDWFDNDEIYLSTFNTLFFQDHGEKRYRITLDPVLIPEPANVISMNNAAQTEIVFGVPHGISGSMRIGFTNLVGMDGLQGQTFRVEVTSATRVKLLSLGTSAYINTTDTVVYPPATFVQVGKVNRKKIHLDNTGGDVAAVLGQGATVVTASRYVIQNTPYSAAELPTLRYARAQDGKTMSITCPGRTPRKLTRNSSGNWVFSSTNFLPSITPPTDILPAAPGAGGTGTHWMKVTSVAKDTGEESIAAERYIPTGGAINVSWASVPNAFEYNVYVSRANTNSIGLVSITAAPSTTLNTLAIAPVEDQSVRPPVINNPFFVDGTAIPISGLNLAADDSPISIPATGHNLSFGSFVRIEGNGSPLDNQVFELEDTGIGPTPGFVTLRYTDGAQHFVTTTGNVIPLVVGDFPQSVTYHQQRLVLGNTVTRPQGVFATRTRSYNSMGTSSPPKDTDAISLEVVGDGVNEITHLISAGVLLAFTAGGIFEIVGNANGVLTPTATAVGIQAFGSSDVRPIVVGNSIVYVSAEGPSVVELIKSDLTTDRGSFKQGDPPLSTLASHLLDGRTLLESARGNAPDNVLWWTRDDGVLLGMTYVAAAGVVGWHRHDTLLGDFESVANVPALPRTDTYFSVKRTLNNVTKRYFERFDQRDFIDVEDAVFLDSSIKFDDAHPVSTKLDKTINLEFFIASGHPFSVGDEFDVTHRIRTAEGITNGLFHRRRLAVSSVGADSLMVRDLEGVIVNGALAFDGVDTRTLVIHKCVTSVAAADHLAGVKVGLLLDGNEGEDQVVGRGGTLTFASKHSRIVVGLPIEADLETLPPDAPGGPFESTQGMQMRAHRAVLTINNTLGLKIGPRPDALQDIRWAKTIPLKYGSALELRSGRIHTNVSPEWGEGKIFLRQSSHLPAHILSIRTQFEVDE